MGRSYLDEIAQLKFQLSEFSNDYRESDLDDEDRDEFKARLLEIMRGVVGVVDDAQTEKSDSLGIVLERAEYLLNAAIALAYEGSEDDGELFATLDSFADTSEHPKIERPREGKGVFSHRVVKIGLEFMKMFGEFSNSTDRPLPRPPTPWKNVVRLHPLSTRCARFSSAIPESAPSGEKPQALSVFQARAEVSIGEIEQPTSIFASHSGKCFIAPAQAGWKGRSPYLYTFYSEDQSADYLEGKGRLLGLANLVSHGAVDDESGLLFVGDSTRIKSYSWWDSEKNTKVPKLLPTHTLDSKGFGNAIGVLPNGRVARTGDGKIGIWNLNELPTHQTTQGLIGGNIAENDEDLDTWRDDPERIERSSGSLPHATVTLGDAPFNVSIWQSHPSMPGTILVASNSEKNDQYYFRALNLENNGKCAMRYLGHGGAINHLSTSKGDPNVLVTAADDGLARLYDVRQPLPVLTIQAGTMPKNCSSAVVCHPDGIPYIFASEEEDEAITLWDVRAKAAVYDLSTGNNRVIQGGMFWNDTRNELYAATYCNFVDRNGRHFDYEPAQIPVERDDADSDGDSNMGGDEDDEEEYQDTEQCWPKNAYHNETYFGVTFDSGSHRIYRYAFKSAPNPEIVPPDGGAMAEGMDDFW